MYAYEKFILITGWVCLLMSGVPDMGLGLTMAKQILEYPCINDHPVLMDLV